MKNIRRFTVVELLAVMALIAILSALGFGVYSYAKGKARESATEALLKQVEAGLESFHTKNGYYPRSKDKDFWPITIALDNGTVTSIGFGYKKSSAHASDNKDYTFFRVSSPSTKVARMKNERLEAFTKAVDMEVLKSNLDADGALTDAWGNRIYYRSPGLFKPGGYDLLSAGPDGLFTGEKIDDDDLEEFNNALEATEEEDLKKILKKFRETDGERVCDDIFNF